jgi:hypothetical protein
MPDVGKSVEEQVAESVKLGSCASGVGLTKSKRRNSGSFSDLEAISRTSS